MEQYIENTVQDIHASDLEMCMVIAGAGNQAVDWLLNVPGASNTILDVSIPYSEHAMADLLSYLPESIVSTESACAMAVRSFVSANKYSETSKNIIGVGCTATIATNREKRGDHRVVIGVCTPNKLCTFTLVLNKGMRDRIEEDFVVSSLLLNVVSIYAGINFSLEKVLLEHEAVDYQEITLNKCLNMVESGHIPYVILDSALSTEYTLPHEDSCAIFPGSFNPLHDGHKEMSSVLEDKFGLDSLYETSIVNVDKPPLGYDEILERVSQFKNSEKLVITNQATFVGKAAKLGGYRFLVGWDTAKRILDPKYYLDAQDMCKKLAHMLANGNTFYVAGRLNQGKFNGINDLIIPSGLEGLFIGISENLFRSDISSTEIRENRQ
tara:strand:+ start:878 stop:2020 length:1143 start_codon:yes stop_codon:yes gene_type:complete